MNHIQLCEFWKYCAEQSATKICWRWGFSPSNIAFYLCSPHQPQTWITPTNSVKTSHSEYGDTPVTHALLHLWGSLSETLLSGFPLLPREMAPSVYQNHSEDVGAIVSSLDNFLLNIFLVMLGNDLLAVVCFCSKHLLELPFSTQQIK